MKLLILGCIFVVVSASVQDKNPADSYYVNGGQLGTSVLQQTVGETIKPVDPENVSPLVYSQNLYHGIGRPVFQYPHGYNGFPIGSPVVQQAKTEDRVDDKVQIEAVKPVVDSQYPQDSHYIIRRPVFEYPLGYNGFPVGRSPVVQQAKAEDRLGDNVQIEAVKPVVHSQFPQYPHNVFRRPVLQYQQGLNGISVENPFVLQAKALDNGQVVKPVDSSVQSQDLYHGVGRPVFQNHHGFHSFGTQTEGKHLNNEQIETTNPVVYSHYPQDNHQFPIIGSNDVPIKTTIAQQANINDEDKSSVSSTVQPPAVSTNTEEQQIPVLEANRSPPVSNGIPVEIPQVQLGTRIPVDAKDENFAKPVTPPLLTSPVVQPKLFAGHPPQIAYTTQHIIPSVKKVDDTTFPGKLKSSKSVYPHSYSYLYRA